MVSARDGAEGYTKASELKPDLIFLDVGLGKDNGLEVLKRFKKEVPGPLKKTPIIMLMGNEELQKQCLEAGAAGYITKPFDLFQLKETLSKFLSK